MTYILNPIDWDIPFLVVLAPTVLTVLAGYSIGAICSRFLKVRTSITKEIAYGNILLLFAFVSGFVFFGIIFSSAKFFFSAFTICILVLSPVGAYFLIRLGIKKLTKSRLRPLTRLAKIPLIFGYGLVAVLLLFHAAIIYFHPIFMEYDAIYLFLPISKSILLGNGLNEDFYFGADISINYPPMNQAMDAWILHSFNYLSLRFLPFYFVIISVLFLYLLARSITRSSDGFQALLTPAIYLVIPAVLILSSRFSLQQDLPFVSILVACFYFASRIILEKGTQKINFGMLVTSVSLLILTREIGLVISIALFFTVLSIKTKYNPKISFILLLVAFGPLYVLTYNDLRQYGPTFTVLFRFLTVTLSVLIIFYFSKYLQISESKFELLHNLKFLILLVIPSIFLLSNFITINGPYPTLILSSEYGETLSSYREIFGIPNPILVPISEAADFLLRADLLFIVVGAGSIFIVFKLRWFGIALTRYKKDSSYVIMLVLIVILLTVWSFLLGSGYETSDIRHILYFSPLLAILIAEGSRLGTGLPFRLLQYSLIVLGSTYILENDIYSWVYHGHFGGFWIDPQLESVIDFQDIRFAIILAVIFIGVYLERKKLVGWFESKVMQRAAFIGFVLLLGFQVYTVSTSGIALSPLREIDSIPPSEWESNVFEVVNYLENAEAGNTLSVRAPALSFFTNRTNFDIYNPHAFSNLLPLIKAEGPMSLYDELLQRNITHIVLPNNNSEWNALRTNLDQESNMVRTLESQENFAKVPLSDYDVFKVISTQKSIDLINHSWTSQIEGEVRRGEETINLNAFTSDDREVYNRAATQIDGIYRKQPSLLVMEYATRSVQANATYVAEIRDEESGNITWSHILPNTKGEFNKLSYVIPPLQDRLTFTLYIITNHPGSHTLSFNKLLLTDAK